MAYKNNNSKKPQRKKKPSKHNKGRGNQRNKQPVRPVKKDEVKEITYHDTLTVGQLAELMHKNSSEIIKFLFLLGNMSTINTVLSDDDIELICAEFNVEVHKEVIIEEDNIEDQLDNIEDESKLVSRPPVVTIMGHVDHGKTTLLDTIRNTNVTGDEFGGITQHIGAYQVNVGDRKVTFLDTPGHEAFTAMRARGAQVTDVVIIVVAADDGVMPQTKEAVDHAKAAGVPIIVAVNKIDKPGANPDRVMSEMSELGVMPEEWGGDTIFQPVSAKTGEGVQDLLETILLVSDMQELKANPDAMASGTVIEAKLDKGRGPVATLLVQRGSLHSGDSVVVGTSYGRVRRMTNDKGKEIKCATPSMPVEIIGLNEVPRASDVFMTYSTYKQAQSIAQSREEKQIEKERNSTSAMSLEDLARKINEEDMKEINVIIKADVQGSAEALKASMEKLDVDTVRINVIRSTVGTISESDILLASASNAIIYGFNIRPTAAVRKKAEEENVEIRLHNIIYKALEELEAAMKGLLAPVYQEVVIGQAEVRETYKVLGSLQRFKDSVKEVQSGYECGLTVENYNDIKVGDLIELYEDQEVEQ